MTDADRSRDAIRQAHPRPPLALHRSGTCPGRDGSRDLTPNSSDSKHSVIESHPGQRGARARSLSSQGRATKTRSWPAAVRSDGIHLEPGRPGEGPYRTDQPRSRRPRGSEDPALDQGRAQELIAQDKPMLDTRTLITSRTRNHLASGYRPARRTPPLPRAADIPIDRIPETIVINDN